MGPTLRVSLLALTAAGVLTSAGAALAQDANNPMPLVTPSAEYRGQSSRSEPSEVGTRQYRYLMRLQTLHERLLKLKAQDGGELTAEHAASLQRQLDRLNHIYGKG